MKINELTLEVEKDLDTFCLENCILNVLKYYKFQKPFLYLNTCLSIILKIDNNNFKVVSDKDLLLFNIEKIHSNKYTGKCDNEDWDKIDCVLSRNIPVILFVDSFYLSYTNVYKKSHGMHTIILLKKVNSSMYSVLDHGTFCQFFGNISKDELNLARNSDNESDGTIFSGIPINKKWKWIERFNSNISETDLLKKMLMLSLKNHFNNISEDKTIIYGVEIPKELIKITRTIISDLNYQGNKNLILKLHEICFIISKKYTFFKLYLEKSDLREQVCDIINVCEKIIKKWNLVNIYFIKWNMQLNKFDPKKILDVLGSIINYDQILEINIKKALYEI